MSADANVRPGGPSRQFHYLPVTSLASGTVDEDTSLVTDTNKVTPLVSFSYEIGGQPVPFYKGFPRIVPPYIKTALIAAGLVS